MRKIFEHNLFLSAKLNFSGATAERTLLMRLRHVEITLSLNRLSTGIAVRNIVYRKILIAMLIKYKYTYRFPKLRSINLSRCAFPPREREGTLFNVYASYMFVEHTSLVSGLYRLSMRRNSADENHEEPEENRSRGARLNVF